MRDIQQDYMNVAIAVSDSFVMPARVMLYSLYRRASRPVRLFLMYNSLSAENRELIKATVERFHGEFHEIMIDKQYFKDASLNNNPLYSIEIYFRILLPYLTDVDKVLWLDADIIVKSDIAELYDKDITGYYVAACIDIVEESGGRAEIKEALGISDLTYFNSGVLLLNNKKIREEIPEKTFFEAIDRFNIILKCPDQDILNYVLGEKCLGLPVYYNYQHHSESDCKEEYGMIIHYIWKKPWNIDYPGHLDYTFWREAVACGFEKEYRHYTRQRKINFYRYEFFPNLKAKLKRMSEV